MNKTAAELSPDGGGNSGKIGVNENELHSVSEARPDYHVVFSTSCSKQQNWESYVFFYHAFKVEQPGNVTRIVSACTDKQQQELQQFFDEYIRPMRDE